MKRIAPFALLSMAFLVLSCGGEGASSLPDSSEMSCESSFSSVSSEEGSSSSSASSESKEVPDLAIESLSARTEKDGTFVFSIHVTEGSDYAFSSVSVTSSGFSKAYSVFPDEEFRFTEAKPGKVYHFTFRALDSDLNCRDKVTESRYYLPQYVSLSLPHVELDTEGDVLPHADYVSSGEGQWGATLRNAEYEPSKLRVYDASGALTYDSGSSYGGAKAKLRGNTSAYSEKKAYKIKLSSAKDLLSPFLPSRDKKQYADKEWLLLNKGANLRQSMGFNLSKELGAAYAPDCAYVNLFVNGDYRGVYLLCDSIKRGNGSDDSQARVAISKTGFLVENDPYWWNEPLYFETPITKGTPLRFTFKYPDADDLTATDERVEYIRDYLTSFEENLLANRISYANYIDQTSFVTWLLCHDILGSADGGGGNMYLSKYDDSTQSRVKMGPGWDYDAIFPANRSVFASTHYTSQFYMPYLCKQASFWSEYKKKYASVRDKIVEAVTNFPNVDLKAYGDSLIYDGIRYSYTFQSVSAQIEQAKSYLNEHLSWMDSALS